jgi:hypothetical protein
MSLVYLMRHPTLGTFIDISGRCRKERLDVTQRAEEGSVGISTLVIDDPLGDLTVGGWRVFMVFEDEAEDPDQTCIYVGHSQPAAQIKRGPYRTGAGREWHVQLSDVNNILYRRSMLGDDNDRPAETDNARIAWILSTTEAGLLDDTRYVTADNPWNMDANDYLLQEQFAIYNDCAQQSGKNFFVTHFGDVGPYPFGDYSLFYEKPEAEVYVSAARLTNVLADIDPSGDPATMYVTREPVEFTIDWSRIASRAIVPFAESYRFATNPTTVTEYTTRDVVYPAVNVNTATTAQARANRYVQDAATPEHRATVQFYTTRAKVNAIREGMLVGIKMSHWPEPYRSEYVNMRVLSRQIQDVSAADTDFAYLHTIEVSRSEPGPPAEPLFGVLLMSKGRFSDSVWWGQPGDTPPPGIAHQPTTGLISPRLGGDPPNPSWAYSGWDIEGDGTIDVTFYSTWVGVLEGYQENTITYVIRKNGIVVASFVETQQIDPEAGFLAFRSGSGTVSIAGLAVANGDYIDAQMTMAGVIHMFTIPAGTGQDGERLAITGGTLV